MYQSYEESNGFKWFGQNTLKKTFFRFFSVFRVSPKSPKKFARKEQNKNTNLIALTSFHVPVFFGNFHINSDQNTNI